MRLFLKVSLKPLVAKHTRKLSNNNKLSNNAKCKVKKIGLTFYRQINVINVKNNCLLFKMPELNINLAEDNNYNKTILCLDDCNSDEDLKF